MLIESILSLLVLGGAFFVLVGSFGLVRLPDFFTRLHAPTKATTLGLGSLLLASIIWFSRHGDLSLHEILIALFLFLTAPVSANLLAKAAFHSGLKPWSETTPAAPSIKGEPLTEPRD
ncbi:MAG: multicomponent K+:H+ antiporter subunit G [Gammaproteobacteria bacterium]|jgi:multicomponent K+:H+ antiporter subunit G